MAYDSDYDQNSLVPTDLDRRRLADLDAAQEGRVEAENGTWIAFKYPTSPMKAKSWKWCAYSVIVTCPGIPEKCAPTELKTLAALFAWLNQLESERHQS